VLYKALSSPTPLIELWGSGPYSLKWALLDGEEVLELGVGREAVVACLKGSCSVGCELGSAELAAKDVAYASGPATLELRGRGSLVVVGEAPSRSEGVWLVRRFSELKPLLVGSEGYRRHVYTALGVGDPSTSLLAGFTEGFPGEWTSFPPHKHDDKVEVYVYYGLGGGFGVQVVEDEDGADAYVVGDYDAVLILRGYHPNTAAPGYRICYLWILCQVRGEKSMRATVKPGFERFQAGPTHLQLER